MVWLRASANNMYCRLFYIICRGFSRHLGSYPLDVDDWYYTLDMKKNAFWRLSSIAIIQSAKQSRIIIIYYLFVCYNGSVFSKHTNSSLVKCWYWIFGKWGLYWAHPWTPIYFREARGCLNIFAPLYYLWSSGALKVCWYSTMFHICKSRHVYMLCIYVYLFLITVCLYLHSLKLVHGR